MQEMKNLQVNMIPATKRSVQSGGQIKKQKQLRVAAYCRVSTEDESQQTSYTTQKAFYTKMITSHGGWTLSGIYADEALSGTSRAKRKDFNRMMDDAQKGRMDYIVTKSISRFARNTVDTLNCVRQLRQLTPPVGIYFEKENIDTLDATGELILTILSALAQDESRSISDNIRWSIQKKFQRGEAMVDLNRMLGYDKGENGEWLVNPEQAQTVRYIFDRYVAGATANRIAKELNERGIKTARGNQWRADAVLFILRNEKYVGDCESQKTVTKNFLTHEASINQGEAPKYYVRNHHAPIIDRHTWDKAQVMLREGGRKKHDGPAATTKRASNASVFVNLTCGRRGCGHAMCRMLYNTTVTGYTDERALTADEQATGRFRERYYMSYPLWRCAGSKQGACKASPTYETALEQSFMEMLYGIKRDYECHHEQSWIVTRFREVCEEMQQQKDASSYATKRLEMLETQLKEQEEKLQTVMEKQLEALRMATKAGTFTAEKSREAANYAYQVNDIRARSEELSQKRTALATELNPTAVLEKNFSFFLRCLMELPETNAAGMKLNVNRLDTDGSLYRTASGKAKRGKRSSVKSGHLHLTEKKMQAAPDLLTFEKGMYIAFVKAGVIRGDAVDYETSFGVTLTSYGNSRTLGGFLGYRKASEDGTIDIVDANWKASRRGVSYTRKEEKSEEK